MVVAHASDALSYGKLREADAFEWVAWAVHAVATHVEAELVRRVEEMHRTHEIAPALGKAQA